MPLKLYRWKSLWWITGTVRGITVHECTDVTDEGAAESARIVRERELLDESVFGKKATVTFEQAAASYLRSDGSPRYLSRIRTFFAGRRLCDIHQADVDDAASCLYPSTSPATRNRQCYTPFIAVWNHAAENEWVDYRKWRRAKQIKGTCVRRRISHTGTFPVSYNRAAQFVSQLPPAPAMVMTALFFTGMRPIELFSLRREDVDVERRWIQIRSSKTGQPRGVPMHEMLAPLFRALLAREDRIEQVFRTFKGHAYTPSVTSGGQLSSSIANARKRFAATGEPINDVSMYTARHTVSTQLVINGVHQHIKDEILGHAVTTMSRRYTHLPQPSLLEAINTIAVPDLWRQLWWWSNPLANSSCHSLVVSLSSGSEN